MVSQVKDWAGWRTTLFKSSKGHPDIISNIKGSAEQDGGPVGLVIGMAIVTLVAGGLAMYNVTKKSPSSPS